jgi:sulfonate transport system substrate-binding protein
MKLICLLMALIGWSSLAYAESAVKLCVPNNSVGVHWYVADHQGFFKEQGVTVERILTQNAKVCLDALLAGQVDAVLGAEAPFTYSAPQAPQMKIVADLGLNPETRISANGSRNISTFAELRGKKIGYLPGTASSLFLGRVLRANNIERRQVTLVPLSAQSLAQGLSGGIVDAIAIWEPWGYLGRKSLGAEARVLDDSKLYAFRRLLVTREDVLVEKRQLLVKVLAGLKESQKYIENNAQASLAYLAQQLTVDEEALRDTWQAHEFAITPPGERLALVLQENLAVAREFDRNTELPESYDYRAHFDRSLFDN